MARNHCCSSVKVVAVPILIPVPATPAPSCVPTPLLTSYFLVESSPTTTDKLIIGVPNPAAIAFITANFPSPTPNQTFHCQLVIAPGFAPVTVYIPTPAELTGNFSDLLAQGLLVYNPASATIGNPVGNPFVGNIIPSPDLANVFAFRFTV